MTTFAYLKGSKIGYVELANTMADFIGDAEIDVDEFCDAIIEEVNKRLPASFVWYPHVSEVHADINETEELTIDELLEMIYKVADELGESWEDDAFIPLNMRNTMDIEQVEREEAEKVAEGTEYSWMDLTDWQSCHDLLHHLQYQTKADEKECRRQFREYFEGCIEEMRRVDAEEAEEEE